MDVHSTAVPEESTFDSLIAMSRGIWYLLARRSKAELREMPHLESVEKTLLGVGMKTATALAVVPERTVRSQRPLLLRLIVDHLPEPYVWAK